MEFIKNKFSCKISLIILGLAVITVFIIGIIAINASTSTNNNMAIGKITKASSVESTKYSSKKAFDGNKSTRWASEEGKDSQWLSVDLGNKMSIAKVKLNWEKAYASSYKIQVSSDQIQWQDVYTNSAGDGGIDNIQFPAANTRYVRLLGLKRATTWGYSLWEFSIYKSAAANPSTSSTSTVLPNSTTTSIADSSPKTTETKGNSGLDTIKPGNTATPSLGPSSAQTPNVNVTNVFFDDFSDYKSGNDPALTQFGYEIRDADGAPGAADSKWSKDYISFLSDNTNSKNKIMRLAATTDGTGKGTIQSEIMAPRKFLYGSYGARIKFSNNPVSGTDGDQINQTYYTITPWELAGSNDYGECDFEYLSNGGWGKNGSTMWNTSWETGTLNVSNSKSIDLSGWHTCVMVINNGQIQYYVDGQLYTTHSGIYYPETPMNLSFNQWFIKEGFAAAGAVRKYEMDVDWTYYAKDTVLSSQQVEANVKDLQANAVTKKDTIK